MPRRVIGVPKGGAGEISISAASGRTGSRATNGLEWSREVSSSLRRHDAREHAALTDRLRQKTAYDTRKAVLRLASVEACLPTEGTAARKAAAWRSAP